LRGQVVASLGIVGQDPDVRAEAKRRFDADRTGAAALDPDLTSAVLGVVATAGGAEEYEAILERYRHPRTPQEEMRSLYALAGFDDDALAARTFELARAEVRTQNAPFVVQLLLTNRAVGAPTWKRVRDRWEELQARIPANIVPRMVDGVRLLCRDSDLADEIAGFLRAHPVRSGQRTVDQTLERLTVNVALARALRTSAGPALAAGADRLGPS